MRLSSFARLIWVLLGGLGLSGSALGAGSDQAASAPDDRAHLRLRELLTPSHGAIRAPTSPRFAALCDPSLHGTRLIVGWLMPDLGLEDRARLDGLVEALRGAGDGSPPAPFASIGPKLTIAVAVDDTAGLPLLTVDLSLARADASKDLEVALLSTVSALAADETTPLRSLARRYLTPLSRSVVEVHPPRPAGVVVRVAKPVRHVIERGDTLSEIALRHGLDLDALVRLNGVDPEKPIHPGEELKLNDAGPPRPKLYVAKAGDTLAKVARLFGVSEKALVEVNRMDVRRLSPGQKLVLPR